MTISYIDIAIKLTLGLISIVLIINVSGKGNLAPASASDQVQNYVLGGVIGGVIYNPNISILQFLIILLIWSSLVLGFKFIKTYNSFFKKMLDGEPIILIKKGVLDVEACRKSGYSAQDIMFKLRSDNVYSIQKVKRAVLEQNGQFIIVLYGEENPKYPIIADGKIQTNILESLDKDEEWLISKLNSQGYESVSQIFIAEYNNGDLLVVPY